MSNMKPEQYFITNRANYYFTVDGKIELDTILIAEMGCSVHPTLDNMYNHVQEALGLERDEVEACEVVLILNDGVIKQSQHAHFAEVELNDGCTIENYIAEYVN